MGYGAANFALRNSEEEGFEPPVSLRPRPISSREP
jgi:hypothetical protein